VRAMRNNAQLYENGINTTAKQYMETVDRKFVVIDAKLRNGKRN
ncbi:lytic transglycosylase domain-containing protein, partial [Acinetobacter baumannii]|nr:lytic transglycosylase domain-containing protein [Acinetobacter baumannii]